MDDPFTQLPRAAVLVYAGVLTAAAGSRALAEQPVASVAAGHEGADLQPQTAPTCGPACHDPSAPDPSVEPDPPLLPEQAPTCGPSCHDPNYPDAELGPKPQEPDPVAPTCGPSCHGDGGDGFDDYGPTPGGSRCTVASDVGDATPGSLALIGLGLGLGLAGRRRAGTSEP